MPYLPKSEASFTNDVCNAAYHNGWRILFEDLKTSNGKRILSALIPWAGRTMKSIAAFLLKRKRSAFTFAYHTHNSQRSQPGYPDLILIHPERQLLIAAELKMDGKYPSIEQRLWLAAFSCVSDATEHVLTRLWRPSDWDEIIETLGGIDYRT